ncbi:MAG TPA: Xaa-Pro peptidase family protein [Verrucomicrobiae bacterium]
MTTKIPLSELTERMRRFRARMDAEHPRWELAAFFSRVNQYYFTGTMQDGLLLVPRDREPEFWVRRSFERAAAESLFPGIRPMKSFRDAAHGMPSAAPRRTIHLETESVPLALAQRFRKHFPCAELASLDAQISRVRAVKSPYELAIMERCGEIHRRILEQGVPTLLREGVSEAEFACDLYSLMVREGHQGIVRFGMFNVDIAVAQLGFGENSVYPTSFDGPGGCVGIGPAAPVLGSRERKLRKGDLVFVDIGCGLEGYQTDKTLIYVFGGSLPDDAIAAHRQCIEIEQRLAAQLKPGAIPSQLYQATLSNLSAEFLKNFMGFGNRRAAFLGHGVGLQIDEPPVIAEGFDEPLVEGMTLALEPKKGVPGVGMVGTENTFVVTPNGGRSITGQHPGLLRV